MIERREFYIDGAWVAPSARRDFTVINPSTEEPAAVISLGSQADTDAAVAAANRAFADWSVTDPAERIALVERALEIYRRRKDEMGDLMSLEMGAPRTMARESQADEGNIISAIETARSYDWLRVMDPKTPGSMIAMEPIGTVGMITPWNWPVHQVTLKVFPALLAGCTMVLKPSEFAPLNAMLLTDILHEAGLPKGVFNLVNGDGAGVGSHLATHPGIDMISFTGSTRAGIAITKAAADSLKRVCLELGGKGANLVFADADERAVKRSVQHCFNNTGQSCNAPTRMLVERSYYDQAIEIAREVAAATRVAPAHEDGPHIGPVVNERQFERVQALIQSGMDEGARLVAGGVGRPEGLNRGYFVRPTVFADVTPGMTIEREEIFGPVLSMIPFDTEDEAIRIANDTPYGLTNYVQSKDGARRNRLALRLRSGMVQMNGKGRGAGSPFGGVKASGLAREGGVWGMEEYLVVKSISGWAAE
jgi:aldehyde dehydrogenase (NAD+)